MPSRCRSLSQLRKPLICYVFQMSLFAVFGNVESSKPECISVSRVLGQFGRHFSGIKTLLMPNS